MLLIDALVGVTADLPISPLALSELVRGIVAEELTVNNMNGDRVDPDRDVKLTMAVANSNNGDHMSLGLIVMFRALPFRSRIDQQSTGDHIRNWIMEAVPGLEVGVWYETVGQGATWSGPPET